MKSILNFVELLFGALRQGTHACHLLLISHEVLYGDVFVRLIVLDDVFSYIRESSQLQPKIIRHSSIIPIEMEFWNDTRMTE